MSSGRCYNLADHVLVMEKGEQLRCPPSPRYASVKSIAVTEPQTISCPHARCAMDRIGLHADIDPIPLVRDRKSTRLNSSTNAHLVCRLLLEKKKTNSDTARQYTEYNTTRQNK